MAFSIQTNVNSLIAQENLRVNSDFQSRTIQRLTSGYRINQSGDDAAGLAIANKFRTDISELSQGVRNANDGISQLQIIDSGMNNVSKMLDRLRTLATQSASQTFTGDRKVVDAEFQTLLSEIDRQAQSIGLTSGGQFAKNLSVYIGGGLDSAGAVNTANGTVNINLANSAVDAKSLGLRGMQALAGSADLSATSSTSVANVVANTVNADDEATPGSTMFYFTGAGFADSSKIGVSVNLGGVTDTRSLVAAINTAIQNAGNGSTQAATAFKNAGVSASIHTDVNGGEQLAFSSSTSAFQVQAGDRMSNALMGNFSTGSTGASLETSVTGQAAASDATMLAAADIYVKISGAGMSTAKTITLDSTGPAISVGAAITSLKTQVAADADLVAAGITVDQNAAGQIVFTNSRNEQFSVEATGDTANALGLGAYQSSGAAADYDTITATGVYDRTVTTSGAETTLEFSINGGPAIGIAAIDLAAGNATKADRTSAAINSPVFITTGANDVLSFSVDGEAVSVTLSAAGTAGAATAAGGLFDAGADPVAVSVTSGAAVATTANFETTDGNVVVAIASGEVTATGDLFEGGDGDVTVAAGARTMMVSVDGGASTLVTIAAGADYNSTNVVARVQAGLDTANLDATASLDGDGNLVITSDSEGTGSSVSIWEDTANPGLLTVLGLAPGTGVGSGFNTMMVAVDGGASTKITVAAGSYDDATIATAVQTGLDNAGLNATASVNAQGRLVITSNAAGPNSSVSIADDATNPGLMGALGLSAGNTAGTSANTMLVSIDGGGPTLVTVAAASYTSADIVAAVQTGLDNATLAATASLDVDGNLIITSDTKGVDSVVSIGDDAANPGLMGALGLSAGASFGTDGATVTEIADQIQTQMDADLADTGASATVTVDTTNHIVITNDAKGAAHTVSIMAGNSTTAAGGQDWAAGFTSTLGQNRDAADLANAINQELAANSTLAAAGLTASVTGGGNLKIDSSNGTEFRLNAGAATAKGTVTGAVDVTSGMDFRSAPMTLQVAVDGAAAQTVTLNQNYANAAVLAAAIDGQLTGASASVVSLNGKNYLQLSADTSGPTHSVQVESGGTANAALGLTDSAVKAGSAQVNVGFGVTNTSSAGNLAVATANSALSVVNASGTSQTGAMTFDALETGSTQALTISANDTDGAMQSLSITLAAQGAGTPSLANDGSGANIDQAVSYINSQLQKSNNATLQSIVAVKQTVDGDEQVNFISSLGAFQVGVGTASTAGQGINGGVAETAAGELVGSGSTISVETQSGALTAVTAISSAVTKLGSAQAAVGRGQNQLNYAVNLAQSQISSFSAAESRIRDADVANEAANLTKAQVLQQASMAAMAQANSAPQAVLALLRG